jgi:hypothetical protein
VGGRTQREAVRNFADSMQRSASCVTKSVLRLGKNPYDETKKEAPGTGVISPYPDKPWLKMHLFDGRFFVDVKEWTKTEDFKVRLQRAREQIRNL